MQRVHSIRIAVLLMTGGLIFLAGSCKEKVSGALALPEGRVVLVKGDVTRNGGPVAVHDVVADGDRIKTGSNASVEVVFGDGMITKFGAESDVVVDLKKGVLHMEKGWFAGVKNAGVKGLEVMTPTVTASVRGTSLCLKVESSESTYACSCNGTVHFHGKDGKILSLTASHHAARSFAADNKVAESSLKYHDDAVIEELARKINHPLDWAKPSE